MICNYLGKLLQVILLPIITAYFTVEEYGYYDLIISSISLVYPLITIQIAEGAFRYIYDSEDTSSLRKTITSSFLLLIGSCFILCVFLFGYNAFADNPIHSLAGVYTFIVLYSVNTYFQKIARGFGKNKSFAYSGVMTVLVTLLLQLVVIYFTGFRVDGLFYAIALANLVSIIYLFVSLKIISFIQIKSFSRSSLRKMASYSLPLVPNSICWYMVSTGNRYIVAVYIGLAANGIFAISNKFAMIIASACSVFQLAWQECAIKESNNQNSVRFFSNVYVLYKRVLLCLVAFFLPLIKLFIPVLVDKSFFEAWKYVPLLLYGSCVMALASFYGAGYLSSKKTRGAFFTTLYASIINVVITFSFIGFIGLYAPCFGSLIAYIVLLFLRKKQMKSYFYLNTKDAYDPLIAFQCIATLLVYYFVRSHILLSVVVLMNMLMFVCFLFDYLKFKKRI